MFTTMPERPQESVSVGKPVARELDRACNERGL